jgi:hypothetical protein
VADMQSGDIEDASSASFRMQLLESTW